MLRLDPCPMQEDEFKTGAPDTPLGHARCRMVAEDESRVCTNRHHAHFSTLILNKRILAEMQVFLERVHPALNTVIIRVTLRVPTFFMAILRHEVIILRGQFRMAFGIERAPSLQLLKPCLPLILDALLMGYPDGLSKLFNREATALGFLGLLQNQGRLRSLSHRWPRRER